MIKLMKRNDSYSLIGRKYGELLVLRDTVRRTLKGLPIYECQCSYGKITFVNSNHLRTGHTKSCESTVHRIKNIVSKRLGKLFVVSFDQITNGRTYWNCICDCGNKHVVDGQRLRLGQTKSCGCINKINQIINVKK